MRTVALCLSILGGAMALESCKTRDTKTTNFDNKAQPTNVSEGSGNGLNLNGTGFVWEKKELPLCYSARNGVKFFVWKEQSTFACNKGQKEWQIVEQKKSAKKKG